MKKSIFTKGGIFALVLAMSLSMTACGDEKKDEPATPDASSKGKEETTKISWLIRNEEPKNVDSVLAKVNEMTKDKINAELDLQFINPGDFNDKMQMKMAGGEEFDLCFTASWANNYIGNVGKGAFLALDDIIPEHAPNHWKTIPEAYWDGVKVNDKIYAMINYQVMYDQSGMQFKKDVVDELGIDVDSVKTWDDITAVLEKVKEAKPDIYPNRGGGVMQFEHFLQENPISFVFSNADPFLAYDPDTKKVSNTLYFDHNKKAFDTMVEWKNKELLPPDAATLKDENTLINGGKIFSRYQRCKPGATEQVKMNTGIDWYIVPMGKKTVSTSAVQSTLTAVSVTSKHPEKAVELYDLVFSDKDVYNTLVFGIEDQDYTKLEGDYIEKTADTYTAPGWMLGNQFNAFLSKGNPEDVWEQTIKGNEEAQMDALYGFIPDREVVESELAACEAVWTEYKDIMQYGLRPYQETYDEMMGKLNSAGLEKITAEMQKQVDAFNASK